MAPRFLQSTQPLSTMRSPLRIEPLDGQQCAIGKVVLAVLGLAIGRERGCGPRPQGIKLTRPVIPQTGWRIAAAVLGHSATTQPRNRFLYPGTCLIKLQHVARLNVDGIRFLADLLNCAGIQMSKLRSPADLPLAFNSRPDGIGLCAITSA